MATERARARALFAKVSARLLMSERPDILRALEIHRLMFDAALRSSLVEPMLCRPSHWSHPLEHDLEQAIDIQQRCYRLLRWVNDQIPKNTLTFFGDHSMLDEVEAAEAWLRAWYAQLPSDARPPNIDDADAVRKFANYFTSYLLASFDLIEEPGTVRASMTGCYCPVCTQLAAASHLQPRRVGSRAKTDAKRASGRAVLVVAEAHGVALSETEALAMLAEPELRRDAALLAYASNLIERVNGQSADTVSLALWRRFAYTAQGAPLRDFRFTVELVRQARANLDRRFSKN